MVPCDGCTACCRGPDRGALLLLPTVDPDVSKWLTYELDGAVYLSNKVNNDCIYVGPGGCMIYETRPETCRMFDCRETVRQHGMKSMPKAVQIQVWRMKVNDRQNRS